MAISPRLAIKIFGKGGDTAWLQPPFFCDYGSNIELGERVFFNFNCVVLDVCKVSIGDYSQFGSGVQILTPLHPLRADLRRKEEYGAPISIGADVWVGSGALILPVLPSETRRSSVPVALSQGACQQAF